MRISSAFPSKYLKASDIPPGTEITVEIERVTIEDMELSDEQKPVLHFVGKQRGWVLNRTNADTLAAVYGDETSDWVGHPVVLFSTTTTIGGKSAPCIRCRVPKQPAAAPTAQETPIADNSNAAAADDVPF